MGVELNFRYLLDEKSRLASTENVQKRGIMSSALPTPSPPFSCSSQVLVQGCLLDPSQREAFLQQVYEQLCLFEDKVATMLQQQYEPQGQVSGKQKRAEAIERTPESRWLSEPRMECYAQSRQAPCWTGTAHIQALHPRFTLGEMKAFACEVLLFVCLSCRFYFSSPGTERTLAVLIAV